MAAHNVLLNHDLKAKVADFGLSSRIYMNNNSNQYIGANQNTFPLCWSAYEILDNGIAIKEKSDVWSFGILMWEIFYLGAAVPYADISGLPALVDYLRNHQRLDKPPLCPQILYELMLSCWNQLYQFRPTFSEIQQDLRDFMTNQTHLVDGISTNPTNPTNSSDSRIEIISEEVNLDYDNSHCKYSTVRFHNPQLDHSSQNHSEEECHEMLMATNRTYKI